MAFFYYYYIFFKPNRCMGERLASLKRGVVNLGTVGKGGSAASSAVGSASSSRFYNDASLLRIREGLSFDRKEFSFPLFKPEHGEGAGAAPPAGGSSWCWRLSSPSPCRCHRETRWNENKRRDKFVLFSFIINQNISLCSKAWLLINRQARGYF